jgi:DNA helicase-2/ATP-dependent DNA helicase PcrA
MEAGALQNLFRTGDRVRHPKFGAGTVAELSGSGAGSRIRVRFDTAGEKELALSVAPIIKLEDEE